MKRLVLMTALVSGLLLILAPRFILPACEYEGYPRMHCSDTAEAEYVVGALLMLAGCVVFFMKRDVLVMAGAACSIVLYVISYWLPDKFGYCKSSRMPCNYGMVPGIRFIDIAAGIIMVVAIIGIAKTSRTRGSA